MRVIDNFINFLKTGHSIDKANCHPTSKSTSYDMGDNVEQVNNTTHEFSISNNNKSSNENSFSKINSIKNKEYILPPPLPLKARDRTDKTIAQKEDCPPPIPPRSNHSIASKNTLQLLNKNHINPSVISPMADECLTQPRFKDHVLNKETQIKVDNKYMHANNVGLKGDQHISIACQYPLNDAKNVNSQFKMLMENNIEVAIIIAEDHEIKSKKTMPEYYKMDKSVSEYYELDKDNIQEVSPNNIQLIRKEDDKVSNKDKDKL